MVLGVCGVVLGVWCGAGGGVWRGAGDVAQCWGCDVL